MPWSCVRGSRSRFGGLEPVPDVGCSPCPPARPACPALCAAGRPVRVSLTLARWYTIPCGLCVPRAPSGCPSGIPRVSFVCVCARAPAASARPPPPVGVARAPCAVPVLGAGRAVPRGPCPSACPAPVPCRVWFVFRGGWPGPFSPTWLWAVCSPWGGSARLGRSSARGWGGGGGRPVRRAPGLCKRGGQWGGGSPCLGPSLCLPWAGNKAGVPGVALAMESGAPIPLRCVLACCPRVRSVWCPGALGRVRLSFVVPAGAGGWGVGAGPAPASLSGAAVLPGGGGIIPSALGGPGAGALVACGPVGGGRGDKGGGRPVAILLSLWRGGGDSLPSTPFAAGAFPPGVRVRSGSSGSPGRQVRPAAGGPAWLGGRGRGGP